MNSPRFAVLALVLFCSLLANAQVRQRATGPVGNSNQPTSQGKSTVRGRVVYNDGQPMKGVNGSELTSAPLTVVEGGEVGPITIKLSDQFATLSGKVISANAGGDSLVLLIPADANRQRFRTAYTAAKAAADGSFSVSLAPGEYLILAKSRFRNPRIYSNSEFELAAGESPAR